MKILSLPTCVSIGHISSNHSSTHIDPDGIIATLLSYMPRAIGIVVILFVLYKMYELGTNVFDPKSHNDKDKKK